MKIRLIPISAHGTLFLALALHLGSRYMLIYACKKHISYIQSLKGVLSPDGEWGPPTSTTKPNGTRF